MNQFKHIQQYLLIHAGIVFLVLMMLFASSCQKSSIGDCFTSTGSIQKEKRTVSYFKSIQLEDNVNLFLNQAGKNKLVVEAGGNLMSNIVTEVTSDSILLISNDNRCNWVRSYDKPINVYLDFTRLDNLDYRSIGDVSNQDTIRLDSIKINVWEGAGIIDLLLRTETCQANLHDGTADIILRGISKINYYYQLGAGKLDARDFSSVDVYMKNWGSNDMYIWATEQLSVEIKGLGNVYYKGSPGITTNLIGEGKLIKME